MERILAALTALWVTGAPPRPAPKARAEALAKSGQRQILAGEIELGIRALEEAHAIAPDPALLLEIADAYDEWSDHCVEALEVFRRFFTACDRCAALEKASNDFAAAQDRCASDITFETHPSGAVVRIDRDDWSRVTPFTTRLRPGRYGYEVHRSGHAATSGEIAVEPASPKTIEIELGRTPGPSDVAPKVGPPAIAAQVNAEPHRAQIGVGALLCLGGGVAAGAAGAAFIAIGMREADRALRLESTIGRDPAEIDRLHASARRSYAIAGVSLGASLAGLALSVLLAEID
jgi:hypothetical protein